ncbi:pur operon repressor [Clostridium cylindrosporum]|uniref:Pur operon repressor n=1 Tax=Clostridium cylindrosporum DSM 605 TaxID=1121307 RepID=A0A0J8DCT9_CLOCY|nr:pur operon repressor [Clostridium cylindrosporum]KMT22069.1 Pur operon repressor [Clostridium cylindrosporum DSM 605]
MERLHRKERVAAIFKILSDKPNTVISLGHFSEIFGAARSTLSEDITIVKKVVEMLQCGKIETIPGAAGGVRYIPGMSKDFEIEFIKGVCEKINDPSRVMPGGFLYINDIIYSPEIVNKVGVILANKFISKEADYVITVETKGIPIAMAVATALNVPLVIVRRNGEVTEGSTVSINYVTGSSKTIQTMSLSKRSIKPKSKCIFIDDFIKAGGTAVGIIDLLKEFDCTVEGVGFLIEAQPEGKKVLNEYVSLISLEEINGEEGVLNIIPSEKFKEK